MIGWRQRTVSGPARRRRASDSGGVALEFAMILPLLVLLLTGGADIVLWLRAWLRIERVAGEVATIASQYATLAAADIATLFDAGQLIAGDIDVTRTNGGQVISLVSNTGAGNSILWQRRIGGYTSRVGAQGGGATLPASFTVPLGQTVLVTEAFNRRAAWVLSTNLLRAGGSDVIYSYTVIRPRSAQLSTPPA